MGEDRTGATGADRRRLTVPQAAEALRVTVDAVRGRIRRGKLEAEHDAGTVYVWIDASEEADSRGPSATSHGPSSDQSGRLEDLREQVAYLREQLDREREARTEERRRQDTIIAQLSAANVEQARTIRAIEGATEVPEATETVEEELDRAEEPHSATEEAQTTTQHQQAQRPTEGVEHDAGALREWTGDVEARRPDAPGAQEGVRRPWWRRVFGR